MRVLIPISADPCAIGMQREPRCSCNSSNTCYPYYGEATKAAVWNRCCSGSGGWTLRSEARRSSGDSVLPSLDRSLSFFERAKTHCGESAFCDVTKGACTEPSTSLVRHPQMGATLCHFCRRQQTKGCFVCLFSHTRLLSCGFGLKIRILNRFMKPYCAFPTDMIKM